MKFMHIELFKIEMGERVSNCGTMYFDVTKIEIEGDNYKITTMDIWTKEESSFLAPTDKYEIQVNKFI